MNERWVAFEANGDWVEHDVWDSESECQAWIDTEAMIDRDFDYVPRRLLSREEIDQLRLTGG